MKDKTGDDKKTKKEQSRFLKEFLKGFIISNPVFVLALGLCPALAVTVSIDNALGMGMGVIFVLMASNIIISSIRRIIPNLVRIPVFIVVIATFVTILSMVFEAYIPPLYESLGIYLALIVVNCIILGRAEIFASKNNVFYSIADALGIGFGFTIAIFLISLFRELLGTGSLSLFGFHLFDLPVLSDNPIAIFALPPGAFLIIGFILAFFRAIGVFKNE